MYRFHTYCCVPSSVNDWDSNFLKALLLFCLWKFLFCVAEVFVLTKSISCSISRGLSSNSSSHSSIDLDLENSISSSTPDAVTTNVVIIHSHKNNTIYSKREISGETAAFSVRNNFNPICILYLGKARQGKKIRLSSTKNNLKEKSLFCFFWVSLNTLIIFLRWKCREVFSRRCNWKLLNL